MELQKTATLTSVFSEVLANLAFMFTEEEPAEAPENSVWLETAIAYEGPCRGRLAFRCTQPFAVLLAANLLGIDPEDPQAEAKADDSVREFMNIVCGQFVTTVHGNDDVFNLSIPQTRELLEAPDLGNKDDDRLSTLFVDGHCVQLAYEPFDQGNNEA